MRDGVIRGGEDGTVRVLRCGQAVGGTICQGRSARSNRSTGALGELSCRHRGCGADGGGAEEQKRWQEAAQWYRETRPKPGLLEKLFVPSDQDLGAKGYMARGGQMVDAPIVPVPTKRISG